MGKSIYLSWRQMELVCDLLEHATSEMYYDNEKWIQEAQETITKLLPSKVHTKRCQECNKYPAKYDPQYTCKYLCKGCLAKKRRI